MIPSVYQMKVTNACNLRCGFCPTFQPWNRRKTGMMNLSLIDKIDWSATKYTELQMGGEPLLHPALPEIIARVKAKGVKVGLSTNATLLDRLAAVIDEVDMVTVDDDDLRDPAFVWRKNVYVQKLGETHPFEDYSRTKKHKPPECVTPFDYVSILWNGDIVPCCKDHSGLHVFGNLYEQTFDQIVHSDKRWHFLATLNAGQDVFGNLNGLCEYCDFANPHEIHDKLLEIMRRRYDT